MQKGKKEIMRIYDSVYMRRQDGGTIMAIIIRNSDGWNITQNKNGKIMKVKDIAEAKDFKTLGDAIDFIQFNPVKTKHYYVYDTCTHRVCWGKDRVETSHEKIRIKRKRYPMEVRKLLYDKADGCCQLCGRKLLFKDVTLDHIVALAVGGKDEVENLQVACVVCNRTKDLYLPDEFADRVFDTFCYQMNMKHGNKLIWRIVHRVLVAMV